MSISADYPVIRPSFSSDFKKAKRVSPRISCSRNSIATYVDETGSRRIALVNQPRVTFDPVTKKCLGLLYEESRTNLLLNSATLNTQSVTVAAVEHVLHFTGTGSITLSGVSVSGTLTGSGVGEAFRVSRNFTPSAGTLTLTVSGTVTNAQLEAGSLPTSYIPTTGTSATRAAEYLTISGRNLTDWYANNGGTIVVAAVPTSINQSRGTLVAIGNGTNNTYAARLDSLPSARGAVFFSEAPSGVQGISNSIAGNLQDRIVVASRWQADSSAIELNSISGYVVQTSSGYGSPNRIQIGILSSGTTPFNGIIERISIYPSGLSLGQIKNISRDIVNPVLGNNKLSQTIRMSTSGVYTLLTTDTVNYDVDWGDGSSETGITSNNKTHTYASGGLYNIIITSSGVCRFYNNNNLTDGPLLTSINQSNLSSTAIGTSLVGAWYGCNSMTNFSPVDTSSCTNFNNAWRDCSSLASFPVINVSSVTNFTSTWQNCSGLTSFPLMPSCPSATTFASAWDGCRGLTTFSGFVNISGATSFNAAWRNCINLNSFPLMPSCPNVTNFNNAWDGCTSMTSFGGFTNISGVTTGFQNAWVNCSGLTSFPLMPSCPSATNFTGAWDGCRSLTTFSGFVNISGATTFNAAWRNCINLNSFPLMPSCPNVTNFTNAWNGCTSMTSFGGFTNISGVTTGFSNTWQNCSGLASFPLMPSCPSANSFATTWQNCYSLVTFSGFTNVSSVTSFSSAWNQCTNLANFPANQFDSTGVLISGAFTNAFVGCALTAQSIENILVSLDTGGRTGVTLALTGGTNAGAASWTTAANTAYTNLIGKGWTITRNA